MSVTSDREGARLSVDALLEQALQATGLDDYGDRSFQEGMQVFVGALNDEARLSAIGAASQSMDITRILVNRLRFQRDLSAHPEIRDEELAPPIVIVGLPRTGTSKLQRTMAADPGAQRLEVWRLLNPSPPDGDDDRIAVAEGVEQMLAAGVPDFMAAHPTEAREPDEELLLLELTFESVVQTLRNRVPSYAGWLEGRSQAGPYRYLRELLQYLQWQDGGGRGRPWIMKSPAHIGELPTLLGTFPGATVVHCHRDPREVLPSFAGLVEAGRRMGSDEIDPQEIGTEMLGLWGAHVDRGLEARLTLETGERFVDVPFARIRDDVMGVIEDVYAAAGRELTAPAREAMLAYDARRPPEHFGKHRYTAERYGLDADRVDARFAAYRERFEQELTR